MVECALNVPTVQETHYIENEFPEVTIAVLNYNGNGRIHRCLDSVFNIDYPNFGVVVIDNGSKDGSFNLVRRRYPHVKTIKFDRNHGFAKAYNMAMEEIESEFVVLMNNDVTVEREWLSRLMPHILRNKDVSAVTPKMLFMQDKNAINAAGGKCDIFGSGWNRGNGEKDQGQYEKVEEVFYANCAATVIRKKAWNAVGPFDEQYFFYGEDLDWCWRARLKGYRILYVPDSKIYHEWAASNGEMIPLLERHWLTTMLKNYDSRTLARIVPKFLALKAAVAAWLLFNGRSVNEKLAVLDSFAWNLNGFRETWRKRLRIQKSRRIADREIQKHMYDSSLELSLGLKRIRHPITDDFAW